MVRHGLPWIEQSPESEPVVATQRFVDGELTACADSAQLRPQGASTINAARVNAARRNAAKTSMIHPLSYWLVAAKRFSTLHLFACPDNKKFISPFRSAAVQHDLQGGRLLAARTGVGAR